MTLEQTISPAIEKFNSLMEEYTQSASELDHTDFKAQEKFEEKWEKEISKAENTMEEELEKEFKEADEALLKEQEDAAKESEKEEEVDETFEIEYEGRTAKQIAKAYKAKDVRAFAKNIWVMSTWKEIDIAQAIIDYFKSQE